MKLNSKYFVFLCIFCILLSISAVSANDNQTGVLNQDLIISNDELDINDNDDLMDGANKSYDDFYEDMKDCTDTFNIENNYVYQKSDNRIQLVFNQHPIAR